MTQPPEGVPEAAEDGAAPATEYEPAAALPTEYEPAARHPQPTVPSAADGHNIPPATEHEPPAGGSAPRPRGDTRQLPRSLRARFTLRAVLSSPDEPHRAAVYRVEDGRHLRILKWYDRAHAPETKVWQLLGERARPHLLQLIETEAHGADGHPYDLAPSYGETDLAAYLRNNPGRLDPAFIHSVVRQLHEALTTLHELGVVHRDVSPANIMLSTLDPADPHVVLVDFGVSAYAPEERYSTRDDRWVGTTAYMSPQAVLRNQRIHPPGDWWSLGMVAAEMAGGRHPMYPLTDPDYLRDEIVSRGPDLSRVTEPRLLRLCMGLLTLDYDHRWGSDEVAQWLAGGAPPVARAHEGSAPGWPEQSADTDIEPFAFLGGHYTRPALLARAFSDNWRSAARLLAGRSTREQFTGWLRQFENTGLLDRAELAAICRLLQDKPGPATLVRLISCLGPTLDASYRGVPLDPAGLRELIHAAGNDDEFALSVLADLRRHTILPLLAHRPGGEDLDRVQQRWLTARARWPLLLDEVCGQSAVLRDARREVTEAIGPEQQLLVDLLALAAMPSAARRHLGSLADGLLAELTADTVSVDWYRRLVADRDDVLRLQLAQRLAGFARLDADAQLRQIAAHRRLVRSALARDGAELWLRRQEMLPMLGWAVGGALALVLPWIFVIGLSDLIGRPGQQSVLVAWMLAVPGGAAVLALELLTAYRIGSPGYHPDLSLAGRVIDFSQRPARFLRVRGARFPVRGLLLLVPLGLLWLTVVYAAWVWPAGTVAVLAWWTWHRLRQWRRRTAHLRARGMAGHHRTHPSQAGDNR